MAIKFEDLNKETKIRIIGVTNNDKGNYGGKMRNTLEDLNNHLFAELERLGDEELAGEELQQEISRAKAITEVANKVVDNANLVLKAEIAKSEYLTAKEFKLPKMLGE